MCQNKVQSKGGLYEAGNTHLFLRRFVAHELFTVGIRVYKVIVFLFPSRGGKSKT